MRQGRKKAKGLITESVVMLPVTVDYTSPHNRGCWNMGSSLWQGEIASGRQKATLFSDGVLAVGRLCPPAQVLIFERKKYDNEYD